MWASLNRGEAVKVFRTKPCAMSNPADVKTMKLDLQTTLEMDDDFSTEKWAGGLYRDRECNGVLVEVRRTST
jgi:hypothetical protein